MPEQSLAHTYTFSVRHIRAFLYLETLDITSALCLRSTLSSEITNKKHNNVQTMALNKLHLSAENRLFHLTSTGNIHVYPLHMYLTVKALLI